MRGRVSGGRRGPHYRGMGATNFTPIEPTDAGTVKIVDQTRLPHEVVFRSLETREDAAEAFRVMRVRGAPTA